MKIKNKILFVLLAFAVGLSTLFVGQRADAVGITVKRVVFEDAKRADVITIINKSNKAETYRLGWKHMTMTENDGIKAIPKEALPAGVEPAEDMVRFSPRRFVLQPGESQQVRMMLRRPSGLADGEYRSHLWVRPEADVEEFKAQLKKRQKTGTFMKMLAGVSMPIIVRKGALDMSVDINALSAQRQSNGNFKVDFSLVRTGQKSSYGDLDLICNKGRGEYLLKFTRGISVYSELSRRNISMTVPPKQGQPACSSVTVRYTETDGFVGDPVALLAEATASVN